MNEIEVLVVGAGPTGLTLAIDLAHRGVRTILVERHERPLSLPKMERTNPRSMEIFRRLGVADRLRSAAYPAEAALDVYVVTSLAEPPLAHLRYPSVADAKARIAACSDGSAPRECYQLISQYTLEPILIDAAKHTRGLTVREGTELISFSQDDSGVTAFMRQVNGAETTVRARYLVACDGGGSTVRRQLGIKLLGTPAVSQLRQVFFRCDQFYGKSQIGAARHYAFAGQDSARGGAGGMIVVQDDRRHFTLQSTAPIDTNWRDEIRSVTGIDIEPEILFVNEWSQNYMIAERYREGRVLLAGDAVHLFIPAGGLGMNTGVGDGYDLAWKLAATVRGWGGPNLLHSYEAERRVVALRNIAASSKAVEGVLKWRSLYSAKLREDSAAGRAARARFAQAAEPLIRMVYEMHGTELGYRYASPIICPEIGNAPPDDPYTYRPTTWPGARLPHVWLADGAALHDRLGLGYTLLRLSPHASGCASLESAIRATGAGLDVMDIHDPRLKGIYERDLVLARPDLHVCWRGDSAPSNFADIAAIVTGWGTAP